MTTTQTERLMALADAINWIDDFIARCNGDDRGSCDAVNIVRAALQAREGEEPEIAMIDAAMVEMKNIVPPLRRSECQRLIRAALAAAPQPAQPIDYEHPDVRTLRKWLNERNTAQIDRDALARVLGMIFSASVRSEPAQPVDRLANAVLDLMTPEGCDVSDIGAQPDDAPLFRQFLDAAKRDGVTHLSIPVAQPEQGEHGWLQSNSLLYRLTDERQPQNCDEINVTMAGGSRSDEARSAQATALLSMLQSAQPIAQGEKP